MVWYDMVWYGIATSKVGLIIIIYTYIICAKIHTLEVGVGLVEVGVGGFK